MAENTACLLTINAGSSSIRFVGFAADNPKQRVFEGVVSGIGQTESMFLASLYGQATNNPQKLGRIDYKTAIKRLADWLQEQSFGEAVRAVGHRVVHGGAEYNQHKLVDKDVIERLRKLIPLDPQHLPFEIELIETMQAVFPKVPQIACFDTAFHHDLPVEARLLPVPRRYESKGVRRYGFHGLSYSYIINELGQLAGPDVATGRVIVAHMGSGVSLAAIRNGKSIDTTMGLGPAGGVPMSTRSGDLDPGVVAYFIDYLGMTSQQFTHMVHHESGLLGISGQSSDMETLLDSSQTVPQAADAVNLFCYQIKKQIGSYAAALGGLDCLVFTAGMGEKSAVIRQKVCQDLEFLGIEIDPTRNLAHQAVISSEQSQVTVRVMPTDEAQMIAQQMTYILKQEKA